MIIKPTKEVLQLWMESYVPEKDLFFLSKEDFNHEFDFKDVLVMPKKEFYNHSTYQQLKYINSYQYWNIKNDEYVIIAEKGWIESISKVDVIHYTMAIASINDIDLTKAIVEKDKQAAVKYDQTPNLEEFLGRLTQEGLQKNIHNK